MSAKIRPKERDAIIQSLRAGVVPLTGQRLIQVGRVKELEAQLKDIDRIVDGGSSFKLVIGDYGSGKSFFLNLVRSIALEKKLVTMHADLSPKRRLSASDGQARSLYAELSKNMSTRSKPEGGALPGIIETFISQVLLEIRSSGQSAEDLIRIRLAPLNDMVNGYDFSHVISQYCKGYQDDNAVLQADAIRWLRGEYSTKTEAKKTLDVRNIVDDASVYDQLKLLARFVRIAGYAGLMVSLDEMVNLYKIANAQSRNTNYEEILRILNDSMQGSSEGLGFVLGGTVEFVTDPRRGLYSYQALQSRLSQNTFAVGGLIDYTGPLLRLAGLTMEDFYVLLLKIRDVYAGGDPSKHLIPDEAIVAFMQHCASRLGHAYFQTPRTSITTFINFLAVLDQNPGTDWPSLIGQLDVATDTGAAADALSPADEELVDFKL